RDSDAYAYAGEIVDQLYAFMQRAHPERAEYVTLVGRKLDATGPATPELARAMLAVLGPDSNSETLSQLHGEVVAQLLKEVGDLKDALATSTARVETLQDTVGRLNETAHELQDTVAALKQIVYNQNRYISHLESTLTHQAQELAK